MSEIDKDSKNYRSGYRSGLIQGMFLGGIIMVVAVLIGAGL